MIFASTTFYFISVTAEFTSTFVTAEGTITPFMVKDVPTAGEQDNGASSEVNFLTTVSLVIFLI